MTQGEKQYFVTVTDEFIESRQLREKVTEKKFEVGNFVFTDCGAIKNNSRIYTMIEIRPVKPTDDMLAVSNIYEQSWKCAYRGIIPNEYLTVYLRDSG